MASLSEENYLKAIYHLSNADLKKVSVKALSDALDNAPASIVHMLKKLEENDFIEYNKKTGVVLKTKGEKRALDIIRKHRLWEVFLLEKLGYSWDEVHDIAEQLEHVKDEKLADKLEDFLGNPKYDPHGDPIPTSSGGIPIRSTISLSELTPGETCRVVAIKNTESNFLKYLLQLEMGIGTEIKVTELIDFDESRRLLINDREINVSKQFTDCILVEE